jgi:hypothetical protein
MGVLRTGPVDGVTLHKPHVWGGLVNGVVVVHV